MQNRNRKRLVLVGLITSTALGLVLVAGCATPSITLQQAKLNKITTKGLQMGINLSVFNPNQYTMPLKNMSWELDLFKSPFTKGGIQLNKQIPANSRTPVNFKLPAVFNRVTVGVRKILAGQTIPWRFGGKANFQTPIGPVYVKFADQGAWRNPLKSMGFAQNTLPQADEMAPYAQPMKLEFAIVPPTIDWPQQTK